MKRYTALDIPSVAWINSETKNPKRFTAASLFAGSGSASLGLKLAGYQVLYASEFVPAAADTYRANSTSKTFLDTRDIRDVSPTDVLRRMGLKRGQLDYLDASPPCKLFSTAAMNRDRTKGADAEVVYSDGIRQRVDDLFDHAVRMLKGLMPRVMVFENVVGLTRSVNQGYFLDIVKKLRAAGYVVSAAVVDASRLGVPQHRPRLLFVGVRKDLNAKPVFPKPLRRVVTLREVVPAARYVYLGDGKKGDARRPCPTMTVQARYLSVDSVFSASGHIEVADGTYRRLTIPELRRVFGLPDDFVLTGSTAQQWERLGRSHAALSVYYVASTLREQILERL